jgi:hypothetical protein
VASDTSLVSLQSAKYHTDIYKLEYKKAFYNEDVQRSRSRFGKGLEFWMGGIPEHGQGFISILNIRISDT